jgi:hypothetical protein
VAERIVLERFAYTPIGSFGRLMFPEFQCYTVERPWLDNKIRESCIPEGEYALKLGMYKWAVTQSKAAFKEFMSAMAEVEESILEIRQYRI